MSDNGSVERCVTAIFTINLPTPLTAPTFSVGTGTYTSAQTETITIPGADTDVSDCVYYTTDSTTPATSSTEYTTALTVGASETVEAIVYDPTTGQSSDATTAIFTINLPPSQPQQTTLQRIRMLSWVCLALQPHQILLELRQQI